MHHDRPGRNKTILSGGSAKKPLRLKAFRRNLLFPGLMRDLGLSGHPEKRFLIRVGCEPHHFHYLPEKPLIQKFSVFTQILAAPNFQYLEEKFGITSCSRNISGRECYNRDDEF
jgi:hypothetical protein